GAEYLTRDDSRGAKAGNMNRAIAELERRGVALEFIAVLDADFIPKRDFIARTLALMADSKVALVQTPQVFYNHDNFQHCVGGRAPDLLRFGFDVALPSRDAHDVTNCAGTSFLVRTAALKQVGGFVEDCVLEDFLTGLELRWHGWNLV